MGNDVLYFNFLKSSSKSHSSLCHRLYRDYIRQAKSWSKIVYSKSLLVKGITTKNSEINDTLSCITINRLIRHRGEGGAGGALAPPPPTFLAD